MDMNGIAATRIGYMVDDGIDREEILDQIMYMFRFSITRAQAQNVLTNYVVQRITG